MSRLLTKADFGYFATISAVIAIAYSISEAGLGASVIQRKESSNEHISTAFTLSLISGSVFSVILFLLAPLLSDWISDGEITVALRIMSVILLINSVNSIANGVLTRKLNFKRIGILQIVAYTISSIVGILLALYNYGLYALVANAIIYPLMLCVGYFTLGIKIPRIGLFKEHISSILNFGGWLTAGVIVNNITHQVDKLMVPRLLSNQALGAYNRPAGFVSTISSKINSIFDSVLFPILSKYQDDKSAVKSIYGRATDLLNTFSVLLSSIFIFNANLIIEIFFGDEWKSLTVILQIISISVIFNINGRLADCFFRTLNLVKQSFFIRLFILSITIISVYIGCKFGLIGIAWGLVFSNVLGIVIKVIFLSKRIEYRLKEVIISWVSAWKLTIPFIVAYLGFYYFCDPQLISNIVFALIFSIVVLIEYIIFPKFVGKEYSSTIYPVVISKIQHQYAKIRKS